MLLRFIHTIVCSCDFSRFITVQYFIEWFYHHVPIFLSKSIWIVQVLFVCVCFGFCFYKLLLWTVSSWNFTIPNCRFWAAHGEFQAAPASAFVAPELRHSGLSAMEVTLLGLLTFLPSSPAEGLVSRDTQLSVCSYFCFSTCLCQETGHFTVEDTVSVVGSFLPFFQHILSFGWEPHPVLGAGEIKTNSLNYKVPSSVGLGPQTKGPVLKWFPV